MLAFSVRSLSCFFQIGARITRFDARRGTTDPEDLYPPNLPFGRSVSTHRPCTVMSVDREVARGT
jgi:hypothetical protein